MKICVKFGDTVLVENVDETIQTKLYPLFVFNKMKTQR